MARKLAFGWVLAVFLASCSISLQAQAVPPPSPDGAAKSSAPEQQNAPDETEPPEEDESVKPRVYRFDPLEAERNIKVGNFYMHKGDARGYRAAEGRYQDATKYNPHSAEAFFHLGEAEEKLKHKDKAVAAFKRVIELAPDSKLAKEAEKKLKHLA